MTPARVTLSQIAVRAGVHVTTVSLALRNNPRLPAATREKIQTLAKEMNYRPDPMLSSLIAYSSTQRKPAFQATIALFNAFEQPEQMMSFLCFRAYREGVQQRAEALGYAIQEISLPSYGVRPAALKRQLLTRGIQSILVFPLPVPGTLLEFEWDEFSVVTLGYSLISPQFNRVTNHQFRSILLMLRELRRLGYRRIGLCLDEVYNRKINMGLSSAYTAYTESVPENDRVPVWRMMPGIKDGPEIVRAWMAQAKPDVIIGLNEGLQSWLKVAGYNVPGDVGFASVHVYDEEPVESGILQNDRVIGAQAVNTLVSMIHCNEKGCPLHPQHVLIDGTWREGSTVRRVGPEQPWFLNLPGLV